MYIQKDTVWISKKAKKLKQLWEIRTFLYKQTGLYTLATNRVKKNSCTILQCKYLKN